MLILSVGSMTPLCLCYCYTTYSLPDCGFNPLLSVRSPNDDVFRAADSRESSEMKGNSMSNYLVIDTAKVIKSSCRSQNRRVCAEMDFLLEAFTPS